MKCSILLLAVVAVLVVSVADAAMRDCGCELTKCNCSLAKCTPELAGTTKVCGSDNFQVPNSCYGCALNCGNRHYKYSTNYTLTFPNGDTCIPH